MRFALILDGGLDWLSSFGCETVPSCQSSASPRLSLSRGYGRPQTDVRENEPMANAVQGHLTTRCRSPARKAKEHQSRAAPV